MTVYYILWSYTTYHAETVGNTLSFIIKGRAEINFLINIWGLSKINLVISMPTKIPLI